MASSPPPSRLTALQRELLEAFFALEPSFFLTGGSALGGYYLGHRRSDDLDLFATPPADLTDGERGLQAAAAACGASAQPRDRFPEFRRFAVVRGPEATLVDLVLDRAPQVAEKVVFGHVRVDSLAEIAANKLCALLSRNEPKDLVDLKAILETGVTLEEAIRGAERKDAGASVANLAFVLDQVRVAPTATLPGGGDPAALERFRVELVAQLVRRAFPAPAP